MTQCHRRPAGGRIDRNRPLHFTFEGAEFTGYQGDTLASALLANGIHQIGSSIRYGRPRGIMAAGNWDPGGLVRVERDGAPIEPMAQAAVVELSDGLCATSLSGKGRLDPVQPGDPGVYDTMHGHCDVAVVGGGPAGLAAARSAAATGARVMLLDEQAELGGDLLGSRQFIEQAPALAWVDRVRAELIGRPEVTVLSRTTVLGSYDHNYLVAAEYRPPAEATGYRHSGSRDTHGRLWQIRASRVVLATGAHEQPMLFPCNDLPGIMLAGSARSYAHRYAVVPGRRGVVYTQNDSGYAAALELDESGVEIACVVDSRPQPPQEWRAWCAVRGIEVLPRHAVVRARGDTRVSAVDIRALGPGGSPLPVERETVRETDCDLLLVSGGWSPASQLFTQSGGRLSYDERLHAFVPEPSSGCVDVVGAARGLATLSDCLVEGAAGGTDAAGALGLSAPHMLLPSVGRESEVSPPGGPTSLPVADDDHVFVDLQRDATLADVRRAVDTGMRSMEHIKRYTTIGTAHDQGRTSGYPAVVAAADALGEPLASFGPTSPRPPYVPVPFALLAGRGRAHMREPVRTTPLHSWHVEHGALFENVGQWKRPWYYPERGETMDEAVRRECLAVRQGVGVMDVSTLGKIEIQGPDAAEFLNRIYTNGFAKLRVGGGRYGMMCTADGMVFDDGVTLRLAEDRFLMSTTTGNAAAVLEWLEEWLQTEWPTLRVFCTSVTEQWAQVALAGPLARTVLTALVPELPLSNADFPFLAWRDTEVAGVPARVARVSFSGELAYEIHVPGWYGAALWEKVLAAGEPHGITPYGTETMHVLRAEKGHVIVGQDTDGTVTPQDLGMGWIVSTRKEFVGQRSHARPDTTRTDRKQLVGLLPVEPQELLPEGGQITDRDPRKQPTPPTSHGHVTSSYRSAALERTFALALLRGGRQRVGETVCIPLADRTVQATVTEPVFYDPEGSRRDG